jgi:hypothetical protein
MNVLLIAVFSQIYQKVYKRPQVRQYWNCFKLDRLVSLEDLIAVFLRDELVEEL